MKTKVPGDVTGHIFTYQQQIDKVKRDIARLEAAEESGNAVDAMDHAINAASGVFHLLEWEAKDSDAADSRKARELLEEKKSDELNLLHDIASRTKHVTVSNSPHGQPIDVRTSVGRSHSISDETGTWEARSKIYVKFEDKLATGVLKRALSVFESSDLS